MANQSRCWQRRLISTGIHTGFVLATHSAFALSLGGITVNSSWGRPLNLRIEINQISPAEKDSLVLNIASKKFYADAGLTYLPGLEDITASIKKSANGREYIQLTSYKPMSSPFLDVIIDIKTSSGERFRSYTLLLDPESPHQLASSATSDSVLPSISSPLTHATTSTPNDGSITPIKVKLSPPQPTPAESINKPLTTANSPVKKLKKLTQTSPVSRTTVSVKRGDTASAIALKNMPPDVSLDQMLTAMLQLNPSAFVEHDVNRMKTGVVVEIPKQEDAQQVSAAKATQTILTQNKDLSTRKQPQAGRGVKEMVEDHTQTATENIEINATNKSASFSPDASTLSKVSSAGTEKIAVLAKDRLQQNAKQHEQEPSNTDKFTNTPTISASPQPTTAKSLPAGAVKANVPPPKPKESANSLSDLLGNPLLSGGIGIIVIIVLGSLRAMFMRKKKRLAAPDHIQEPRGMFMDGDVTLIQRPGGSNIDTQALQAEDAHHISAEGKQTDLVAEAEVYIAYGKFDQALNLLQQAIDRQPHHEEAYIKHFEIYAKQKDNAHFQALGYVVKDIFGECHGIWTRVISLAQTMETPHKSEATTTAPAHTPSTATTEKISPTPEQSAPTAPLKSFDQTSKHDDLDLNFDFNFDSHSAEVPPKNAPLQDVQQHAPVLDDQSLNLNFPSTQSLTSAPFPHVDAHAARTTSDPLVPHDPGEAKLMLAQEFVHLGNVEGAKLLLSAVIQEVSDAAIKQKAKVMLDGLQ